MKINYIKPQEGFQQTFLSSAADIVIGGSAAGVGKTFALLLEPLRHVHHPEFRGVIFRRTTPQIRNAGALWDTSLRLYPVTSADPKESSLDWHFPSGATVSFRHLEYEKNIYDWQGSQIEFVAFDELTHFTEKMFFYFMTRGRSTTGIRPYIRATCNPDPESWVAKLVEWWVDKETGLPIKEREGIVRYFIRFGDAYIWGDTIEDVKRDAAFIIDEQVSSSGGLITAEDLIKSITFISGSIYDNKELLKVDPAYIAGLLSQDEDTVNALLRGSWKMSTSPNDVYDYAAFNGMFDNVRSVSNQGKYITADIAMKGSDKFIVLVWHGREIIDISVMPKSDGKQVIDKISEFAKYYQVNNSYICYDADGVGSYIDGFIKGSVPFNGGTPAIEVRDETSGHRFKENYFNLKTQCYYRSGDMVNRGEIKISEKVASTMYDDSMTVRQRFLFERKAIKRSKVDMDGKLKIIGKDEMKAKLGGQSPDLMDALMMREIFDLKPSKVYLYANN